MPSVAVQVDGGARAPRELLLPSHRNGRAPGVRDPEGGSVAAVRVGSSTIVARRRARGASARTGAYGSDRSQEPGRRGRGAREPHLRDAHRQPHRHADRGGDEAAPGQGRRDRVPGDHHGRPQGPRRRGLDHGQEAPRRPLQVAAPRGRGRQRRGGRVLRPAGPCGRAADLHRDHAPRDRGHRPERGRGRRQRRRPVGVRPGLRPRRADPGGRRLGDRVLRRPDRPRQGAHRGGGVHQLRGGSPRKGRRSSSGSSPGSRRASTWS